MLQKYLNANLLNVMDDDDHKKLSKSSEELTKKIAKSKAKAALFTLVAIDPDINPENPAVMEVKELIIRQWTTFSANAKDTALVFIRAIILESLKNLLDKDGFAETIWYTSRNIIKYRKLTGKEKDVIYEFLNEIGISLNQKAITSWSIEPDSPSREKIELKSTEKYLINKDNLTKYLEDAAGPTNKAGVNNYDSPNPVWSNSQATWSHEFAPRAALGIKKSIDPSIDALKKTADENKAIIEKFLNSDQSDSSVKNKQSFLALRSQLLWWKEAAYSDSLEKGYDELERKIMGLVLAYDYSKFIPTVYPKSVDYFLKHSYRNIIENTKTEVIIKEFLQDIYENSSDLQIVFGDTNQITELPILLNFADKISKNEVNISQLTEFTGIPEDSKIKEEELVQWLFQDFLLLKVLKQK